jgi:L-threonylcarbamoyladenylate synthase
VEILSPNNLKPAIELLKKGGVLIYPTETSYGIGCDATNPEAVAKVFAIKNRPNGKGVTLLLPSNDPFGETFAKWQPRLKEIAAAHWPGALNIVVEVREASAITTQCMTGSTVAVRRSSHPVAQALVDQLGIPLVSTSANISGEPELYDAQEIIKTFQNRAVQPDAVIDAGELPRRKPSTLIGLDQNKNVTVLRQGDVFI